MAKKLIFFFICFVASAVIDADDTPHRSFSYLSQEPFVVNYKGVDVSLLGNGE